MGPAVATGGGSSVMGDMIGLGVGMAAMGAMAPQVGEMMKGMNMGADNTGSNATPSAGAGIKCPGCGKALPEGAKFCMECGQSLAVKCPNCGSEMPMGAKFCLQCGTKLL